VLILAERHDYPVSVIICDLDHFKAVNDRYGHLAGDQALRVFGGLVKQQTRVSDICCRYGGEEFLLIMPEVAEVTAVARAECLRSAMGGALISYGGSQFGVTASFGVAAFPRDGRTAEAVIVAADNALYAAKTAGRNCVSASSGLVWPLPTRPSSL
jgi:diguanylate cyclase (GGDEF)-like protein